MNRPFLSSCAALLFAAFASPADAVSLQLAHFAPGVPAIDLNVNGVRVAQSFPYGGVMLIDAPAQALEVEVLDSGSGEVLHSQRLELAPEPAIDAMLIVSNAERYPQFGLMLDQGLGNDISDPHFFLYPAPPRQSGVGYSSLIHLARPAGAEGTEDVEEFELRKACSETVQDTLGGVRSLNVEFGGASLFLGQITDEVSATTLSRTCDLELASYQHGVLALSGVEEHLDDTFNTVRYIAIGDGSAAYPYELLVVVAGEVVARTVAKPPEPAPELISTTFWWDRDRPSHGVTLFEMPGAGILYGTWSTFDEEGNPVWFLLDGVAEGLPLHRDVRILATSMDAAVAPRTVGSGQIVYVDCNQAEARFVLDGEPLRSLRLRRSVPVEQCFALDFDLH